jgi:malonyl-CoA O-methyltransferase
MNQNNLHDEPNLLPTHSAYDEWAGKYDDADPSTLLDEPFLQARIRPLEGCRVLDLGCGTGRYLRLVSGHATQGSGQAAQVVGHAALVVGMDLSRGMLQRARCDTPQADRLEWVQASVERLPFLPESFNRVISGLVLDHVANLDRFFDGVAMVLKPGGRAVITAVHPDMQRFTGSQVRFHVDGREYRTEGTIHEVADVVRVADRAGLVVEELQEPQVDETLAARRPAWRERLGRPALLMLALSKRPNRK